MEKYYYVEELCPVSHYTGLYPVVYEAEGDIYRRKKMCCRSLEEGKCREDTSCKPFLQAPEMIEKAMSWKLTDHLIGR